MKKTHPMFFYNLISKIYVPGMIAHFERKGEDHWEKINDEWTEAVKNNTQTEELAQKLLGAAKICIQWYKRDGTPSGIIDWRDSFILGDAQPAIDSSSVAAEVCAHCSETSDLKFEATGDKKSPTRLVCSKHTKENLEKIASGQTSWL